MCSMKVMYWEEYAAHVFAENVFLQPRSCTKHSSSGLNNVKYCDVQMIPDELCSQNSLVLHDILQDVQGLTAFLNLNKVAWF